MDYAPVRIGVWNCADSKFSSSTRLRKVTWDHSMHHTFSGPWKVSWNLRWANAVSFMQMFKEWLREASYGFVLFSKRAMLPGQLCHPGWCKWH